MQRFPEVRGRFWFGFKYTDFDIPMRLQVGNNKKADKMRQGYMKIFDIY